MSTGRIQQEFALDVLADTRHVMILARKKFADSDEDSRKIEALIEKIKQDTSANPVPFLGLINAGQLKPLKGSNKKILRAKLNDKHRIFLIAKHISDPTINKLVIYFVKNVPNHKMDVGLNAVEASCGTDKHWNEIVASIQARLNQAKSVDTFRKTTHSVTSFEIAKALQQPALPVSNNDSAPESKNDHAAEKVLDITELPNVVSAPLQPVESLPTEVDATGKIELEVKAVTPEPEVKEQPNNAEPNKAKKKKKKKPKRSPQALFELETNKASNLGFFRNLCEKTANIMDRMIEKFDDIPALLKFVSKKNQNEFFHHIAGLIVSPYALDIFEAFLNCGMDPNLELNLSKRYANTISFMPILSDTKTTLVELAVNCKQIKLAEFFLDNGALLERWDHSENCYIPYFLDELETAQYPEFLEFLIQKEISRGRLNHIYPDYEKTMLHLAICKGHAQAVDILCKAGADLTIRMLVMREADDGSISNVFYSPGQVIGLYRNINKIDNKTAAAMMASLVKYTKPKVEATKPIEPTVRVTGPMC